MRAVRIGNFNWHRFNPAVWNPRAGDPRTFTVAQWNRIWHRLEVGLIHALAVAIAALALVKGLELRRWAWENTTDIHFVLNLRNPIDWGRYVNSSTLAYQEINASRTGQYGPESDVGFSRIYDLLVEKYGEKGDFNGPAPIQLDYPPLRLMIAANWAAWAQRNFPTANNLPIEWQPSYQFNRPMLEANVLAEAIGAIAMFLLVRYWVRRCATQVPVSDCKGLWPGLFAGLLLWFNPAVIWNAHCFPQWDTWLIAPFLLAIYLALNEGWLTAGLLIGVAAMAKGQILIVAPLLLIWPMVSLRLLPILRLTVGMALGVALVVSPWIIQDRATLHWAMSVLLALAAMMPLFFLPRASLLHRRIGGAIAIFTGCCACAAAGGMLIFDRRSIFGPILIALLGALGAAMLLLRRARPLVQIGAVAILGVGAILLLWTFVASADSAGFGSAALLWTALALGACALPRRAIATWAAGGIVVAATMCITCFNGSTAWYTVGLEYGTRHWKVLAWRFPTNLAGLLQTTYGWGWAEKINLTRFVPFINERQPVAAFNVFILCWVITVAASICGVVLYRRQQRLGLLYGAVVPLAVISALLPVVLRYGFGLHGFDRFNAIAFIPRPWVVTMRYLLIAAYIISLALCGIGLSRHVRRRDLRLLCAVAAPWVLLFALLPQMQPRYLMWGAAFSSGAAALGSEGMALYLALTIASCLNMARDQLMGVNPGIPWPPREMYYIHFSLLIRHWIPLLGGIYPHMGWALIVLAGVWLYLAVAPSRRRLSAIDVRDSAMAFV